MSSGPETAWSTLSSIKYTAPWGPGTKHNTSTFYPSKETAARAILAWAGKDWPNRVAAAQATTAADHAKTAPSAKAVSMVDPMTPQEADAVAFVRFSKRKTRSNVVMWVFRYRHPWGPGGKLNQSAWYSSKEMAARAIVSWDGGRWRERVEAEESSLVACVPAQLQAAEEEARLTHAVRLLRSKFVAQMYQCVDLEQVRANTLGVQPTVVEMTGCTST